MKNLENVKALNDMEMAKVAGGGLFFVSKPQKPTQRNIFVYADDANPAQENNLKFANPKFANPKFFVPRG